MDDDNFLQAFVEETREHLTEIEPDLLALESGQGGESVDAEVVNRIFRAVHSMKGGAGFFGFTMLKDLSHVMENLLMNIRDGSLQPTPEVIDSLLAGLDKLNTMMEDVTQSDQVPCQDEIQKIGKLLNPDAASKAPTPVIADAEKMFRDELVFSAKRQAVLDALASGNALMGVCVDEQADLVASKRKLASFKSALGKTGTLLSTELDPATVSPNREWVFMLATAEPAEALASTLKLPTAQCIELDFMCVLENTAQSVNPCVVEPAEAPAEAIQTPASDSEPEASASTGAPPSQPAEPQTSKAVAASSPESVRVRVNLLDNLMNLAGEMVLLRNQLNRLLDGEAQKIDGLPMVLQHLDLTTTDMQEHIMQTRMQPLGSIFGKFPRVVRDLAKQLDKKIDLRMSGEDVELDKSLIEVLSDPLTHLIRNCCDHGVETPDVRKKTGKPENGTVFLQAFHEGGQINIRISDDGKGIDADRVMEKALSKGIITASAAERITDREKMNLIFAPGLSTAQVISDVSGRGVGLDVVKTNIEKLGGSILLDSEPGMGASVLLRLPLTLAIIPSLIIGVENHRFALPQVNLVELIYIRSEEIAQKIEVIGSATVLRLRDKLLPLIRLSDVLGIERTFTNTDTGEAEAERRETLLDRRDQPDPWMPEDELIDAEDKQANRLLKARAETRRDASSDDFYVCVVKAGNNDYGVIVDDVLDLEEIVVKSLSSYLKDCQCFSGSTILDDGKVAMILDTGGIASDAKLSFAELRQEELLRAEQQQQKKRTDTRHMDIILFQNAVDEVFAIPLDSILRLEKFQTNTTQHLAGNEYLIKGERSIPLIRLEKNLPVAPFPSNQEDAFLILPKAGQGSVGIVASKIVDSMSVDVSLKPIFSGTVQGVQGGAVINGTLTIFIEPDALIQHSGVPLELEASVPGTPTVATV